MLDHHIQRALVYKLALNPELRFSELKPGDVESKLFTYHLKKVLVAGFAKKTDDGRYELTPEGRRLGAHILDNTEALYDRAYSVLFLAVKRKNEQSWLFYKRKTHPLLGKVGFMHATPNAIEHITETARAVLKEKTGLTGKFRTLGSGFFRIYEEEKLESFTNFTLLVCDDATGELAVNDDLAEYIWTDNLDSYDQNLLPNMPVLIEKYHQNELFFLEKTI